MTQDELVALWEEHIRHEFDTKNTDPTAVPTPITGDIEFRNLNFAYPDGPPVLQNINLTIPLSTGNTIHIPLQSAPVTPTISNHPRLALTATKRIGLTGRERVNRVEPWRPFVA